MAAGGPGDHPVSDICTYGLSVFSPKADDLVVRISRFVPWYRLAEMLDWFNPPPLPELERQLASRLEQLEAEARRNGWEVPSEYVCIEGPVEVVSGRLMVRIPLEAGGDRLAASASGIGEVVDGCLDIEIQPWLAEKLRISDGSLVVVDNRNGKFTITRSEATDE
jgi:hypothetical protein